ncbi:MAG: hypothetical protein IPH62_00850 [Ignavibacteriae bacterium]|nr:hypothetical protein [Ignavibacteriota bacterium]
MDNANFSIRTFQKVEGNENPIEISLRDKLEHYYTEIYEIIFDSIKSPIYLSTTEYNKSNQWYLGHQYYFDSNGRTNFYSFFFSCYDSVQNKMSRKYHLIQFSENFEILSQAEWYEDDNFNVIQDIFECQQTNNFIIKYFGCNNFLSVINKFNIKL